MVVEEEVVVDMVEWAEEEVEMEAAVAEWVDMAEAVVVEVEAEVEVEWADMAEAVVVEVEAEVVVE